MAQSMNWTLQGGRKFLAEDYPRRSMRSPLEKPLWAVIERRVLTLRGCSTQYLQL